MGKRTTVYDLQSQKGRRKWLQLHVDNAQEAAAAEECGITILSCEPDHHLEGIRVAAIRPGLIDTEIHAAGGEPDRAHRLAPMVPMKRVGTAEEIANAIVWLLSDEASYITSAILDVSGGR